jgi:catechol 2,3-dioxygenase-like lactoylglutathione lyase family enzyme
MTTTASRLSTINRVIVPSIDQDRAIDFYVGVLGFEKRAAASTAGVEVYPPDGSTGIAPAPPRAGAPQRMGGPVLRRRSGSAIPTATA